MQDSIFTKIINGEIPSYRVYEDDLTYAFLNIHPLTSGHTLVVPKRQVEYLWDLDDTTYQAVMATAKRVANHLRDVLDVPYVGEKVVGVEVPHAHVHIIPFETPEQIHKEEDTSSEPDHAALAAIMNKVQFS